jgi:hypothetical protein
MRDLVALAVARTLGVSSKMIFGWELNALQRGIRGAPGMLETQLQVHLFSDLEMLRRLQNGERRGSWALHGVSAEAGGPLDVPARLDVVLLYGKETQHIFKALAQQMVYRKPAKRRK